MSSSANKELPPRFRPTDRLNVLLLSGDIETFAHGTELDRVPLQMMARARGMNTNDRDHVIASTTGAAFTKGDSHD